MAKKDDAIQSDVSEENIKPTPEMNPRNAHMNDLAARARENRTQEMKDAGFDVPDEDLEKEEEEDELPPAAKKEEKPVQKTVEKEKDIIDPDEELITLKVEGQDVQYPKSKIMDAGQRALQKELTADKNLEEAKRIRTEADDLMAKATELMENAEKGKAQSEDANLNEKLSDIAGRLQFGDEEDGQVALKELVDLFQMNTGKVDTDALTRQVMQDVQERTDWQNASAYVEEHYDDVMSDDIMRREFGRRENEYRDAGDERPYKDLYIAIAEELRDYRKGLSPTSVADSLTERRERKKTSEAPPSGHSVQSKQVQTEKPKTTTDVIAEMRKARGQGG